MIESQVGHVQEEVSFVISATWRHGGPCPELTPVAVSNRGARTGDAGAAPEMPRGPGKRPHSEEIKGQ